MTSNRLRPVTVLLALSSTLAVATASARAQAQDAAPPTKPGAAATPAAVPSPAPAAAPTAAAAPAAAPAPDASPAPAAAPDTAPAPTAPAPASSSEGERVPATAPTAAAEPPAPASAPAVTPEPAPVPASPAPSYPASPPFDDSAEPPSPREVPLIDVWLGMHVAVVSNARYDVFAENDALTSFTAGLGLELADLGAARLALVASTELGGSDARVRGRSSELMVTRLGLGPELRFPVVSGIYAYGRVSPLAAHVDAELSDSSSGGDLEQSNWQYGADASLGLALRFAAARPRHLPYALGFHLRAEAGYAALSSSELSLAPSGSGAPIRSEPLALGDFSLSGFQFRTALALSY